MTEDVSDKLWTALGSAAHRLFEDSGDEQHLTEERLYLDIDGWTISGAIDVQRIHSDGSVAVLDYKMTSTYSVSRGIKPEWEKQLNCYGALVRRVKGVRVTALKVVAIFRDWKSRDAENPDYPQAPIAEIDIPMWDDATQDAYLEARVKLHQDSEFKRLTGEEVPDCSPEETWNRPDKFAVIKTGGARAIKVFDTEHEARAALKPGQEIEHRMGDSIRCEGNWCGVRDYCTQYKGNNSI